MDRTLSRGLRIAEAVYARRKALADLMHSRAMGAGDVADAVRQITESATQVLELERSSVWRLVDDGAAIECLDLFERGAGHTSGLRIERRAAPAYFAALERERSIAAHDARTDPRTSEFRVSYLLPNGITAMLDAPVFVRGKMVGVVCNEHTRTPRTWDFYEELLAATFADFVAHVIETADWQRAEEAVRRERDELERRVDQRTADLKASEASVRALLDLSPVAMLLTRATDHTVRYANRRASAMFEMPVDVLLGQRASDYGLDPTVRAAFVAGLAAEGRVDDAEVELRSRGGRRFWTRVSAQRMAYGGEETILSAIIDISEQRETEARLSALANHDALTGVYNRRHLEHMLDRELERAHRYGRPLSVAIVDADHFKRINDTYGHPVGDSVLRGIADRCCAGLRASDVFGRYGGEEFVVVFPETELSEARQVAERIRAEVADLPIPAGERALPVTISIGVADLAGETDQIHLLARADAALYAAKQSGRNRVMAARPAVTAYGTLPPPRPRPLEP